MAGNKHLTKSFSKGEGTHRCFAIGSKGTRPVLFVSFVILSLVLASLPVCYTDAATHTISIKPGRGVVIDSEGNAYEGGQFVAGEPLSLVYIPKSGYEFVSWGNIDESVCTFNAVRERITITSLLSNIVIEPVTRYYAASSWLVDLIDIETAKQDETVSLKWTFMNENVDMTPGQVWVGMPSIPLIVENRVYVRAYDRLYMLDIDNGNVLKSVPTVSQDKEYYHSISYGAGVILDCLAGNAYDLDLNKIYGLPSGVTNLNYYDGYFYGFGGGVEEDIIAGGGYELFKLSVEPNKDLDSNGIKKNLMTKVAKAFAWRQYGTFSSPVFKNGHIYTIEAHYGSIFGNPGYRGIAAVNLETGDISRVPLEGMFSQLMDDGWLTTRGNHIYTTSYSKGLFGGGPGDKPCMVASIKVDGLIFSQPIYTPIGDMETNGLASGFVIHGDRGYVNVSADTGGVLFSFNIGNDGIPVMDSRTDTTMTHGSLVISDAYFEKDSELYLYLASYVNGNLFIIKDTYDGSTGKWKLSEKSVKKVGNDYCSQAIRAAPNGDVVYYVDDGKLSCFEISSRRTFELVYQIGNTAKVHSSPAPNLYAAIMGMKEDVEFDNNRGLLVNGDECSLFGYNAYTKSWVTIRNPISENTYSYHFKSWGGICQTAYKSAVIINNSVLKAENWYYVDDAGEIGGCSFSDKASLEAAAGRDLFWMANKPVGFFVPSEKRLGLGESSTLMTTAQGTVYWRTSDSGTVSVEPIGDGRSATVKGIKPGISTLTAAYGENELSCTVIVSPVGISYLQDGTKITKVNRVMEFESGKIVLSSESRVSQDFLKSSASVTKETYSSSDKLLFSERTITNVVITGEDGKKTFSTDSETTLFDGDGKEFYHIDISREEKATILNDGTKTNTVIETVIGKGHYVLERTVVEKEYDGRTENMTKISYSDALGGNKRTFEKEMVSGKDGVIVVRSSVQNGNEITRNIAVSPRCNVGEGGKMVTRPGSIDRLRSVIEEAKSGVFADADAHIFVITEEECGYHALNLGEARAHGMNIGIMTDAGSILLTNWGSVGTDAQLNMRMTPKQIPNTEFQGLGNNPRAFSLEVFQNDKAFQGKATVKLKYESTGNSAKVFTTVGGDVVEIPCEYDVVTKTVSFVTNHFSDFAVVSGSTEIVEDSSQGSKGYTPVLYIGVAGALLAVAVVALLAVRMRR